MDLDAASSAEGPPPITDGTPAESAKDLSIRVLQMISIMETIAEGRDVVVVAADSDLLSVWQAAIAGAPLEGHSAFAMASGEARLLEYEIGYGPNKGHRVTAAPGATTLEARVAQAVKIAAEAGAVRGPDAATAAPRAARSLVAPEFSAGCASSMIERAARSYWIPWPRLVPRIGWWCRRCSGATYVSALILLL